MMEENQTGIVPEKRADNDNRRSSPSQSTPNMTAAKAKPPSLRQRWNGVQLSKTTIVWICLGMIAGTMLLGFTWGGWQTSNAAQKTATSTANDAVVQRLAAICVANFQQDPAKAQKLEELKAASSNEQRSIVSDQGWALMPGEEQADRKVAAECAKWLMQLD
jgi:predicted negative regulator of RcsB-dependent stress response